MSFGARFAVFVFASSHALLSGVAGGDAFASPRDQVEISHLAATAQKDEMQTTMHSLALYVLASDILATMRDGAGDAMTLEKVYGEHPGWIPAFQHCAYDEEKDCLFVPLGQCVWKISSGRQGETQFSLLFPQDRDLQHADRMMLMQHLFKLGNAAVLDKRPEQAERHFRVAEALLSPPPKRAMPARKYSCKSAPRMSSSLDYIISH